MKLFHDMMETRVYGRAVLLHQRLDGLDDATPIFTRMRRSTTKDEERVGTLRRVLDREFGADIELMRVERWSQKGDAIYVVQRRATGFPDSTHAIADVLGTTLDAKMQDPIVVETHVRAHLPEGLSLPLLVRGVRGMLDVGVTLDAYVRTDYNDLATTRWLADLPDGVIHLSARRIR